MLAGAQKFFTLNGAIFPLIFSDFLAKCVYSHREALKKYGRKSIIKFLIIKLIF